MHGGAEKAVYAYPSEHYEYWRTQLSDVSLSWGAFGENLTTSGLREDNLYIGDLLLVGSAVLQVTQPRMPGKCLKRMAPQVGLEPTTLRLTAGCSAIELLRSVVKRWERLRR